ncbi:hypothetical protein AVEN_59803-1 [Araneus ventricosus]|uniref:Uncharacterized protein n=1 Tax=Araneus ventricosus TaxID=182803 RepID=A0A4Y2QYU4_ARAVE|nr:hypothetical protein AVEN_59803-1 [Araneus ventricosus]
MELKNKNEKVTIQFPFHFKKWEILGKGEMRNTAQDYFKLYNCPKFTSPLNVYDQKQNIKNTRRKSPQENIAFNQFLHQLVCYVHLMEAVERKRSNGYFD